MSSEKPKAPKLRGFAGLIGNLINVAKEKEECKIFIKGVKTRVLLSNQEDKKWAVLITVIRENITVQGVQKDQNVNIKKLAKKLKAWGYWDFPSLASMAEAKDWKTGKWMRKMAGSTMGGMSQIGIVARILSFARPS